VNRRDFLLSSAAPLVAAPGTVHMGHRVFDGLACHGGAGHLVYYDSKTGRMHDVGDLNRLCSEEQLRRGPQSKTHARFGEGRIFRYDPRTDEIEELDA
jgi:hypothetical protein